MSSTIMVSPGDPRTGQMKRVIQKMAPISWVTLFEADRWRVVKQVALALEGTDPVGMATLAPTDEEGRNGPCIIGIWVRPDRRRKGIGRALLKACAEESVARYGQQPSIIGVSHAGFGLAQHAAQRGIPLLVKKGGGWGDLP